ncbi:unnamed protein product [Rotaria sp. Silwood1]|nr:unnamed protein product [Rotaria sp. Silwood1]CAF5005892.1 unnamed protein product [Rotaria sp. Silwood1]
MIWAFGTQDQGESWHFALIDSYADVGHNIIIEETASARIQGYCAIDDIDIRDSYCETSQTVNPLTMVWVSFFSLSTLTPTPSIDY